MNELSVPRAAVTVILVCCMKEQSHAAAPGVLVNFFRGDKHILQTSCHLCNAAHSTKYANLKFQLVDEWRLETVQQKKRGHGSRIFTATS